MKVDPVSGGFHPSVRLMEDTWRCKCWFSDKLGSSRHVWMIIQPPEMDGWMYG